MGCDASTLKSKKKDDDKKKVPKKLDDKASDKNTSEKAARESESEKESLDIPIPRAGADPATETRDETKTKADRPAIHKGGTTNRHRSSSSTWPCSTAVDHGCSAARAGCGAGRDTPSPKKPRLTKDGARDKLGLDETGSENDDTDNSSSSSAPQLFRISPTNRADTAEGSWHWWVDQLRRGTVTRDGACRTRLQGVQTRLACQHDDEPTDVELDLGRCYMERTAPYVLGKLLAAPGVREVRWVTSLRLDGNYFTAHGFGNMLATMSEANERRTIMPLLEQLYVNNMNLDRQSVIGIFSFLFPVDYEAERRAGMLLGPIPEASAEFTPRTQQPPRVPLFPSLSILSLCDNPGLGTSGLAAILRWLLASHLEPHVLSALDLSRCGIDRSCVRVIEQYFLQLPVAITDGRNPVMPRSLVLLGNRHGIRAEAEVCAPPEIRMVL